MKKYRIQETRSWQKNSLSTKKIQSSSLHPWTHVRLKRSLESLNLHLEPGPDGITSFFLKAGLLILAESPCDLFNLSLAIGVFPDCWKTVKGCPILKRCEKNDRSNYRPISVLPVLSRVLEKLAL